ncbi:hypothetical protein KUTeg_021979 [Tegillarca granosa]|uniref:Geranylgeranyl transferase type-2 subunit beta n=1 Tax=Tegillarca granosa TaxID=220873 RepID=A0ABQ9EAE3_TEGGR|nr:hypothetical protein KUTeg_021979 [Tegillarca granosa]
MIPDNAPKTLLLQKHVDYIAAYGGKKDEYEYSITEYLRMSGIYWGLTVMDLMGHLDKMNKNEVLQFVQQCQHECGGIGASIGHDPHLLYTLSAVQGRLEAIDVDKAVEFVLSCMNFDGGFGCRPGSESHSGQIYCCVGFLAITGQLHHINADLLGWWLCERQLPSGGLNGQYILDKLTKFILACQDDETGGFADRPGDMVDPFHTLFGIAGLSLLGDETIKAVNPVFCLPESVIQRTGIRLDLL